MINMPKKTTVLYADDERAALRLFSIELNADGRFIPEVAISGELALSKIRFDKDKYGVVILDINMGENATGIDIANSIKKINPNILIVIYSGYDGFLMKKLAEESGAIFKFKNQTSILDLIQDLISIVKL